MDRSSPRERSELYKKIQIKISPLLPKPDWHSLKASLNARAKIGALVELLKGKLSRVVMELVMGREHGLFPKPKEIKNQDAMQLRGRRLHVQRGGVGNRLDASPELPFLSSVAWFIWSSSKRRFPPPRLERKAARA
jgi:hypothetical protein